MPVVVVGVLGVTWLGKAWSVVVQVVPVLEWRDDERGGGYSRLPKEGLPAGTGSR